MKTFIQLDSLRFYAYHGEGEQERRVGNEYVVSLRLAVDLRRAMQTDDVADTVNYAVVFEAVRQEMAIPSRLLEHVAGRIATRIFADFPIVKKVKLIVRKRNPPMGADCEEAAVSLSMARAEMSALKYSSEG